jgi:hypothetical protein
MDLDTVTSISQVSPAYLLGGQKIFDRQEYVDQTESIVKQYKNFDNLGINYLKDINDIQFKAFILRDLIDYCIENYLTISNYDDIMASIDKTIQIGEHIYSFIIIDCYNIFIPNYLSLNRLSDLRSFDTYYNKSLLNDPLKFKKDFMGVIKHVIKTITRLMTISKEVSKDPNYINLMVKFGFYLELVNFFDADLFLNGYFRPILNRFSDDLIWRIN